ncbi:MAG: glycoside hydrolase family 99-like domain-containing protein, partial [Planctomycetes bacterium]|nr:glycoside hydrolase family 99-like domain-containing protein [Planctomycetota bacterium]
RQFFGATALAGWAATGDKLPASAAAEAGDQHCGSTRTNKYDYYNARTFGAQGDGKHDDTGTTQRALHRADRHGGGVVALPARRFLMCSQTRLVIMGGLLFLCLTAACVVAATRSKPAVTVGVYYFDGWNYKNSHLTRELATRFAYRKPPWGWYDNTEAIMVKEIDLAADHSIAFFAFDWFYKTVANNNALHLFLKAPNCNRMHFCVMETSPVTPRQWKNCSRRLLGYFKEPTYLRLGGQPLLIIYDPGALIRNFGGVAAMRKAFGRLRAQAQKAGIPGIQIAGIHSPANVKRLIKAGYNEVTGYKYRSFRYDNVLHSRPERFSKLIASSRRMFDKFAFSPLLYIPAITVGCDHRGVNNFRPSDWFPRTPHGLERFVRMGVRWIYHFHHGSFSPAKRVLMLGAWNEYGSDAFLTPTAARGDAYLDAVKRAVATPPNAHTGELPSMRKIVPPPGR